MTRIEVGPPMSQVWDILGGGRCAAILRGHWGAVHAVQGWGRATVFSASADGTIRKWGIRAQGQGATAAAGQPWLEPWECKLAVTVDPVCRGPTLVSEEEAAMAAATCPARLALRGPDLISRSANGAVCAWDPSTLCRRRGPAVLPPTAAVTAGGGDGSQRCVSAARRAGPMISCTPSARSPSGTVCGGGWCWLAAGAGAGLAVLGRR